MTDSTECPNCGDQLETVDDLEETEVTRIDTNDDGSFNLFGNADLFLCEGCKNPLGFRSND